MLVLPEMKFYTYCMALIPVYYIIKELPDYDKFVYLLVVCVLPILAKMLLVTYDYTFLTFYQYYTLLLLTTILLISKKVKTK